MPAMKKNDGFSLRTKMSCLGMVFHEGNKTGGFGWSKAVVAMVGAMAMVFVLSNCL